MNPIDGPRVIELNHLDEVSPYQFVWRSLFAETRDATFFQTYEWFACYWAHFGDRQRMRALMVLRDDEPVGILPLVVRTESTKIGPMRVLTYPLHDWGSFYGPIGPFPTATLVAGLRYLRDAERDWDLLDLRWIDEEHVDRGRTATAMRAVGLAPVRDDWQHAAIVDLTDGWDAYWATRSSHWRNNCRRNERRLSEHGQVRLVRYRPAGSAAGDDDPRWPLFEQCVEIARRSWQGEASDGTTLCHEEIHGFLRDTHAEAVRLGMLDLSILEVGDRPVAFAYNYHHLGRVFGLRMGHDRDEAMAGAGSVLLMHMLADSARRGDTLFDLGTEYLDCKRNWLTELRPSRRVTHYPPLALRAQAIRLKRWLVRTPPIASSTAR